MDIDGEENLGNCLSSFVDNGSSESHRYYLARRTLLEMLRDRGYAVPSSEIELSLQEFRDRHGQTPDVDALRISALHRDDPSLKTLVLFCAPNIVKVNVIRAIVAEIVSRDSLNRLILVVQNKITSQALKAVELISCKVEIFQILNLLVNITKHELKPKHQVLTDEEKESLLKKYSVEEKQLQDYCPLLFIVEYSHSEYVMPPTFITKEKQGYAVKNDNSLVLLVPHLYEHIDNCEMFEYSNLLVLPRMSQNDAIARYYGLEKGQVVKVTYNGEITQLHVTYRCVW